MTATAAGVASTSLAALEPGLVYPTLNSDEAVVADLVVTDKPYNADATGQKDNTAILQRAIDDLAKAPHRAVYIGTAAQCLPTASRIELVAPADLSEIR